MTNTELIINMLAEAIAPITYFRSNLTLLKVEI